MKNDIWFMNMALEQAELGYKDNEVPVGALVVDRHQRVIAMAHNEKEGPQNPCGHAEVLALQRAGESSQSWRLQGATIYVTLEPCPMCLMAMVHSRVGRLVFGAYDYKGGSLSLGYDLYKDSRLNHQFKVLGGLKHLECSRILSQFFREKRAYYKKQKIEVSAPLMH